MTIKPSPTEGSQGILKTEKKYKYNHEATGTKPC